MAILNKGTLVLLGCAIALGGAVLFIENRNGKQAEDTDPADSSLVSQPAEATGELMFPFSESEIESFTLSRPGELLSFSKDDEGVWQMTEPEAAAAEGGAIAFLLSQTTSRAVRSLSVDADSLDKYGLAESDITVDLVASGESYQFLVGDADFTGDQRYVRAIVPEAEEETEAIVEETPSTIEIHLVSGGITNAVERPTAEWLAISEDDDEPDGEPDGEEDVEATSSDPEEETDSDN